MTVGMIKVSVLYPHRDDLTFDESYYMEKHSKLVVDSFGDALKKVTIEKGLAGAFPGSPPPFVMMANLYFDSVEAFQTAFAPHAGTILADISKFTNTQPTT